MTFSSFNSSYGAPSAHKSLSLRWYLADIQHTTVYAYGFTLFADDDARLFLRHMQRNSWNALNRFIRWLCNYRADLPESSSQINVEEKQEFSILLLVVRFNKVHIVLLLVSRCAVDEGHISLHLLLQIKHETIDKVKIC